MDINQEWAPNQADPEPSSEELTRAAMAKGYTRAIWAESDDYTLSLLVKPDADIEGTFRAWDQDESEWLKVNGWLFSIEDVGA